MTDADLTGRTLAGRYDLLSRVGRGGMGVVYRTYDRELDEIVALKVIRSDLAGSSSVARFRHEVKLARRVTSPHVARMFELGVADGITFCTMELVDGDSLRARLDRAGKLPVGEAIAIASQVCDALVAAHAADIIHRDIKPDNVLVARDGRVVLADFGVAALRVVDPGEISGTAQYMAPEQARGEPATPATDVYAVGVVLREMIDEPTGDLALVIARATAPELAERIASAAELRALLAPESPRWFALPAQTGVDELATVVVLPPTAPHDASRLHVAYGVHEELLARLAGERRLRILPRSEPTSECTVLVELAASERMTLSITRAGRAPVVLELPLSVEALEATAAAATQAIASVAREDRVRVGEATELMLRARFLNTRDPRGVASSLQLLERALSLDPTDPAIAAAYASAQAIYAFFDNDPARVTRAEELVADALRAAPHRAEAHVAAGLVELNAGDPVVAALHFRRSIACAPYVGEAHDYLGRMLLEAGYFEAGLARIADACAMSPVFVHRSRWDVARAYALEGRWAEADAMVAELRAAGSRRDLTEFRFGVWRRDKDALRRLRDDLNTRGPLFDAAFTDAIFAIAIDDAWPAVGARFAAVALERSASRRRHSFQLQLAAELAGYSGDAATCLQLVASAASAGLFDLHWADKSPMLELVRGDARFSRARARIRRRAEAILDALYGDADAVGSETTAD